MKALVVIIRNDAGQVLLLDTKGQSVPTFPGTLIEDSESHMKVLKNVVRESTGLEMGGLFLIGDEPYIEHLHDGGTLTIFGYGAYINGGKMLRFPTDRHGSFSWASPTLALQLKLQDHMRHFIEKSQWITGQRG